MWGGVSKPLLYFALERNQYSCYKALLKGKATVTDEMKEKFRISYPSRMEEYGKKNSGRDSNDEKKFEYSNCEARKGRDLERGSDFD